MTRCPVKAGTECEGERGGKPGFAGHKEIMEKI